MRKFLNNCLVFILLISLNSCFINRVNVGTGPTGMKGEETVKYDKKKQLYLLWGLMALKHPEVKTPVECGYQVKTSFNVIDGIVSIITAGIFSMRTVKVEVLKNSPCDPKIIKQERKLEKEEMNQGK